jgi:predicted MFS family arabinose efflux permease
LSAGVAVAVAPIEERGRALAKVFAGMSLAQVIGVPAGAWLAYRYGWHAPFYLVAAMAAVFAAVLLRVIPRDIHVPAGSVRSILTALGNLRLMLAVSFTAMLMTSVYIVFTFFGPLVEASTGPEAHMVPLYFGLFGIGAVSGNFIGGYLSDRFGPVWTLVMVCLGHMVMLPLFVVMPWNPWLLALIVTLWSAFAWCFMPPQQTRLVAIAPEAPALALALNAAMIYAGIAIGSSIGARLLAWNGLPVLGIAAGISAAATLALLLVSDRFARTKTAATSTVP